MPKISYQSCNFSRKTEAIIKQANDIIREYRAQGFDLTLRQLYYQFVARDLLKNRQKEYKRLGEIVNNARLAGRIDWDSITDRTRNLRRNSHWTSPQDIIDACVSSYAVDMWATQGHRVEVWIEKDALLGVLDAVCPALDVPYFSCRGYTSQSEMWAAAQRLMRWEKEGWTTLLLHLGDHDPSGVDMTRDIEARLQLFGSTVTVKRIALTMEQVEQYEPPPNPAKMTDSRAQEYVDQWGDESWELDALDPATLTALIRQAVEEVRDDGAWQVCLDEVKEAKRLLGVVSARWDKLTSKL